MRRRQRVALVLVGVGAFAAAVLGLTALSSGSEGPLSASMARIGAVVMSIEQGLRHRFGGPGRRAALAWFEPYASDVSRLRRPDRPLLGAFDDSLPLSFSGVERLERSLGTTFPIIQVYTAWGDKPDQQFPQTITRAISEVGSVPLVTWEPWLTDFQSARHPGLPLPADRDAHGLAAIARGDYNFYVDAWAAEARRFGKPLLVRFAHEMNDAYRYPWGPQHNSKEEFIAAWRHVVARFRAAGATNVLWVWSPHVAYEYWDLYYPGDEYVDWVATGVLNFGPIAQWSQWWTFAEIFGTRYERLAAFGKPIMIAEFGSLAVGGDRTQWYDEALTDWPRRYPVVKALVFFHVGADQTVTYQRVDWRVTTDSALVATLRRHVRSLGMDPVSR